MNHDKDGQALELYHVCALCNQLAPKC